MSVCLTWLKSGTSQVGTLSLGLQPFGRELISNSAGYVLVHSALLDGAHAAPDHTAVQWGWRTCKEWERGC